MHKYNPVMIHVTENTRRRYNRGSFSSSNTISTVMQTLANSGVTSRSLRSADCHRPISGRNTEQGHEFPLEGLDFGWHIAFYRRSNRIYREKTFKILHGNEPIIHFLSFKKDTRINEVFSCGNTVKRYNVIEIQFRKVCESVVGFIFYPEHRNKTRVRQGP